MIEKYLNYIKQPRAELDNHPICPYAKKYFDTIWIWKTTNIEESVKNFVANFPINKKVVILLSDPCKYDYKTLKFICNENQTNTLWLSPDHPDHYNEINGVKTNNENYAMILIQDRKELNKYSEKLKETTYYNFWSKEYYKEIVEER